MAESGELEPVFPWMDWENQLAKSPTGALVFDSDDFGSMTTRRFRDLAKKALGQNVTVRIRGEEVLVVLNA